MRDSKDLQILQLCLMCIYKMVFELFLMPTYIHIFSYMSDWRYEFDPVKWIISNLIFVGFLVSQSYSFSYSRKIYEIIHLFVMCICIIPLLSTYAFCSQVDVTYIIYPAIYWLILVVCFHRYAVKKSNDKFLHIPFKADVTKLLLCLGILVSLIVWFWAGRPIILSLDDTTEQRMALRAAAMPAVLNYPFMIFGGTVLPYMFAYCMDKRKRLYAIMFLMSGMLLFFTNGMKTWLFMYLLVIGIFIVSKYSRESNRALSLFVVSTFVLLPVFCWLSYQYGGRIDYTSQLARVTLLPNVIGFKSVGFFLSPDHEYLYLRESVLRSLFETPYPGGSDFYINYGGESTLTSSRANNGLWGDAFRNFGVVGMVIYPLLTAKIFRLIELNSNYLSFKLRIVIIFIVLWHSVNASFFTWLLTGGVVILWLILKIDKQYERQKYIH